MDDARRAPFMRVQEGKLVAGVCAGFAHRYGVSLWLVRGVFVLAVFGTIGLVVVAYAVLARVLRAEPPRGPRPV